MVNLIRCVMRPSRFVLLVYALLMHGGFSEAVETDDTEVQARPPREFGSNWLQGGSHVVEDMGLNVTLADRQWLLDMTLSRVAGPCRRLDVSALVYDPELGLMLVGRRDAKESVVADWSLLASGGRSLAEVPLKSAVQKRGSPDTDWPRFPLRRYEWIQEPVFDEGTGVARWSFVADSDYSRWGAFSWLLFDAAGYTSVLLISRPMHTQAVWVDLGSRAVPPIQIVDIGERPPPQMSNDDESVDAGFLTLLQLGNSIGCSLTINFGNGY